MYLARIYITLKPGVNDPQGLTIRGGLRQLGFDTVQDVRAGKYMEIRLDEDDRERASEPRGRNVRPPAGESGDRAVPV